MKFKMLHYEVRYFDKTEWEKISEVEVLESLQDAFVRITPALKDMIQGKRIATPDAIYRIKGLR
jgi:hypothetical protein